jgi:hypothetical protein
VPAKIQQQGSWKNPVKQQEVICSTHFCQKNSATFLYDASFQKNLSNLLFKIKYPAQFLGLRYSSGTVPVKQRSFSNKQFLYYLGTIHY